MKVCVCGGGRVTFYGTRLATDVPFDLGHVTCRLTLGMSHAI